MTVLTDISEIETMQGTILTTLLTLGDKQPLNDIVVKPVGALDANGDRHVSEFDIIDQSTKQIKLVINTQWEQIRYAPQQHSNALQNTFYKKLASTLSKVLSYDLVDYF